MWIKSSEEKRDFGFIFRVLYVWEFLCVLGKLGGGIDAHNWLQLWIETFFLQVYYIADNRTVIILWDWREANIPIDWQQK